MIGHIFVAIRVTTQSFGDRVEQRAATHTVRTDDLECFDLDFVTRGMIAGALGDLVFVKIIFLHQSIGETQRSFSLGLRRIGMICPLKNRANFVSDIFELNAHLTKLNQACCRLIFRVKS